MHLTTFRVHVCLCVLCDSLITPNLPHTSLATLFPPTFPLSFLFLSFPPCPAVYADSNLTGAGLTALKAAG